MAVVETDGALALGDRVRSRRRALGLSQAELADGRFSKQYVSQIERGATLPSAEVVEWLAGRLGVDRSFLETGISIAERERVETAVRLLERLLAEHRYGELLDELLELRAASTFEGARHADLRATACEVWALLRMGLLEDADDALTRAAGLSAADPATGSAEVAYLRGVRHYFGSSIVPAIHELGRSLELLDRSHALDDGLRCDVHQWRSRCYRRLRDWEAALDDVQRALELAEALDDSRRIAEVNLQASLLAERQGRWLLARRHAQVSLELFTLLGDDVTVGRVLNNLGGLDHLLGNDELAVDQLRRAFAIFVEWQLEAEAGYVMGSLAEIHRSHGRLAEAERCAQQSLELLRDRPDHVQEIGTTQLVLARTHLDRHELDEAEVLLTAADRSYVRTGSVSHQARSWVARGDLASLRADEAEAARLYRQAAVALQPVDPAG